MAAAIATIHALYDEDGIGTMVRMGTKLRDGFDAQAASHGVGIRSTGPVQMPNLAFEGDTAAYERAMVFASECARRGLIVHPVTPEVEAAWRNLAEQSYPTIRTKWVPTDLFDEVRAAVTEYRKQNSK